MDITLFLICFLNYKPQNGGSQGPSSVNFSQILLNTFWVCFVRSHLLCSLLRKIQKQKSEPDLKHTW
jgi:hypothetical protein